MTMRQLIVICCLAITLAIACNPDKETTPESKLYMLNDGIYEIPLDSSILLQPRITYDYNSTYTWTDENGNVLSNELNYKLKPTKRKDYKLSFSFSNSRGEKSMDVLVVVAKNISCDSVDNVRYKMRANTLQLADSIEQPIIDGIIFNNKYINDTLRLWDGFVRSTRNDGNRLKENIDNIGCVYIRNGSNATKNTYMSVACLNDYVAHIEFTKEPYIVKSIDIANDFSVYATSYEGVDTLANALLTQLPHSLIIIPISCDKNGNTIAEGDTIKLIDCLGVNDKGSIYYAEKWTTVDLSYLGAMNGLKFKVISNHKYIEPRFCLDNLKLQDP